MPREPFKSLALISDAYRRRRLENGGVFIDLPEVKIRVANGVVSINPLPILVSRDMVREAMLMAGEAAAGFFLRRGFQRFTLSFQPVDGPPHLPPVGEIAHNI